MMIRQFSNILPGKAFYSPGYASPEQENVFPDMRSTVYWNPEVITNGLGEAGFSFYTSESNSSYLVIVQGTDLNGGIGVLMQPLIIAKKEKEAKNNSTGTVVNFKHNMD
ncbi:hypothetical protein [Agriterribacter sp.]|uniref:hypothetical protein n=1 Tax=Agriterribacter sp. TaxID=2821509 RepID=UPI002CF7361F|nr:hypothetical protein [Agriterribacter sp.]HRQ17358.1 hypothetical protein [Agriterribacter sp.]